MTDLPRSARPRRSGRRPSWLLVTALLVLAIVASSALVFTNRVELLKLAVILALWAAVVAAFVSVIYRRQSDADQAKVRDLKLVYDLQLDREISARREYELSVETQLRRELASEIRAQAADEVAALRAELAALRTNLEILFDADLSDRPAIETERTTVRAYSDWARDGEPSGRVSSSRIDADYRDDHMTRTDESPIIDVPAEPQPPEYEWAPPPGPGGVHRRASDAAGEGRRQFSEEPQAWVPPPPAAPQPPQQPPPRRQAEPAPSDNRFAWAPLPETPKPPPPQEPESPPQDVPASAPPPPEPEHAGGYTASPDWQPAPAQGEWIPAGAPGSNWAAASVEENGLAGEYVGKRRAPEPTDDAPPSTRTPEPPRGRHSAPPHAVDPGRPPGPGPSATAAAAPEPEPAPARRHRSSDDEQTGGQSVAELLSRLQASPTGGGRRRRREE